MCSWFEGSGFRGFCWSGTSKAQPETMYPSDPGDLFAVGAVIAFSSSPAVIPADRIGFCSSEIRKIKCIKESRYVLFSSNMASSTTCTLLPLRLYQPHLHASSCLDIFSHFSESVTISLGKSSADYCLKVSHVIELL